MTYVIGDQILQATPDITNIYSLNSNVAHINRGAQ